MTLKQLLNVVVFILLPLMMYSQHESSSSEMGPMKGKMAIGIHLGMPGFGGDVARNLTDHVSARLKFNFLKFSQEDYEYTLNEKDFLFDFGLNVQNLDLLIDYHPFTEGVIRFTVGISYFLQNEIHANGYYKEGVSYGEIDFTPEEVGLLGAEFQWTRLVPYLAIGFGRSVPKGKLGFGFELGTYYIGSPKPTIIATGMLEDTKNEEEQLKENLASFKWLPSMNIRISYKL